VRRRSNLLIALVGALVLVASPALANQTKCEADQLKEIGKYSKKLYKCLSKATKSGQGAGECVASASNKLSKKLAKIEDKDNCTLPGDFPALDLGLQTQLNADANEILQSLSFAYASVEPCEADYADIYEVRLRTESELLVRVDTTNDAFYFDPGLAVDGVTNFECVAGDRIVEQLMETEFECSYDPQMIEDEDHPDGFCPQATITSGAEQLCQLTVFVEGSCEDTSDDDDTRGDYLLEVFIDGQPAAFEQVGSNVDLGP